MDFYVRRVFKGCNMLVLFGFESENTKLYSFVWVFVDDAFWLTLKHCICWSASPKWHFRWFHLNFYVNTIDSIVAEVGYNRFNPCRGGLQSIQSLSIRVTIDSIVADWGLACVLKRKWELCSFVWVFVADACRRKQICYVLLCQMLEIDIFINFIWIFM